MKTAEFSMVGLDGTRRDYAEDGTRVWGVGPAEVVVHLAEEPRLVDGVREASRLDREAATAATRAASRLEQLGLLDALRAVVQSTSPAEIKAVFTAGRWQILRHRHTLYVGETTPELLAALADAQSLATQDSPEPT